MFNGKNDIAVPVCMCCEYEITYRWLRHMHMLYTHDSQCERYTPDELLDEWKARRFQLQPQPGVHWFHMSSRSVSWSQCPWCRGSAIIHRCGIYERKEKVFDRKTALLLSTTYTRVPGTIHCPSLPPSICISLMSSLFPFTLCYVKRDWVGVIWGKRGVHI